MQPLLFKLLLKAAVVPDADGDGAQETVGEEVSGFCPNDHAWLRVA